MKLLDLFSGIGGFSYVFHGVHKTIAYCEIEPVCQGILKSNMVKGRIDEAPIHDDISKLVLHAKPEMITAGFPCQDISSANPHGKGLDGNRSGLYRHILGVIDSFETVKVVFLENSPNIIHKGADSIIQDLYERGFTVDHMVLAASDVGAPHRRKRWYLLAHRNVNMERLEVRKFHRHDWRTEPCSRIVPNCPKTKPTLNNRCQRLGNSIVPAAVVTAWNMLCTRRTHVPEPREGRQLQFRFQLLRPAWKYTSTIPTPTFHCWHSYRTRSARGAGCIGNFIYWERGTYLQAKKLYDQGKLDVSIRKFPDQLHIDNVVMINPQWVEWLMGYPQDYTDYSPEK